MKKIVILGCENSHADTFLGFIKNDEKYKDVEVIGVYSTDAGAAEKLSEKYGVKVMDSYDEAVGKVDGVIVTARRGNQHYEFAKPYIASGVPMFIDKPVTISEDEAVKLARECKAAGVRLTGGSSCIHVDWVQKLKHDRENNVEGKTFGGLVRAPISLKNDFGGFFFYCEHLIGIVSTIFGYYPLSVRTFENGRTITVVFRYEDYDIIGLFVDGNYVYYAMRATENTNDGETFPITSDSECFNTEFDEFYSMLNGGKGRDYAEFISTVFVMSAVNRSMKSGNEEKVNKFEL